MISTVYAFFWYGNRPQVAMLVAAHGRQSTRMADDLLRSRVTPDPTWLQKAMQ